MSDIPELGVYAIHLPCQPSQAHTITRKMVMCDSYDLSLIFLLTHYGKNMKTCSFSAKRWLEKCVADLSESAAIV